VARAQRRPRALGTALRLFLLSTIAANAMAAATEPAADEPARLMNELMSGTAAVGGPFTLADPDGRRRSLAEFRGQFVLLYFGYTSCADACPADLAQMAHAVTALGAQGAAIQPIFITLDPGRDTAAVLRNYAQAFHPRLLALRGTEAETRRIARLYKVAYRRVPQAGPGGYLLDHSAFTYVLDGEGKYLAFLPPGTPAERTAAMLRDLIGPAPQAVERR
jgi:protein SCO1/2